MSFILTRSFKNTVLSKYFVFAGILLILYFFIGFGNYIYMQPQGFHFSRQTDSLSFIYNYLYNGFDFFYTANFNLNSIEGRAASEFPLFYYLYAFIIKLFNTDHSIVRIINLVLVFISMFFLFRSIEMITKNTWLSMTLSCLFFSSTVFLHYAVSYIPDVNSLALCFIGIYLSLNYLLNNNHVSFYLAVVTFTLCVLIKPTYLIYYGTFIFIALLRQRELKQIAIISISMAVIVSWVYYIQVYNKTYEQYYYLTTLKPLWKCTPEQRTEVYDFVLNYWYSKYYYQSSFHFFYVLLIVAPYLFFKNRKNMLTIYALMVLTGCILYFFTFFIQFKDHDYYFITIIPGIAITISVLMSYLFDQFKKNFIQVAFTIALMVLTALSLNYAREKLSDRYLKSFISGSEIGYKFKGIDTYLDSLDIDRAAKLVIVGDITPNGGLFFTKRKGYPFADLDGENEALIKDKLIKSDYLIIPGSLKSKFDKKLYICYNDLDLRLIGSFRNNFIYKVK